MIDWLYYIENRAKHPVIMTTKGVKMANTCENTIYFNSDNLDNVNYIKESIEETFNAYLDSISENEYDGYFDSKWDFPEISMKEITDNLPNPNDDTLYIRVLSVEYGCYYHALNVYSDGEWNEY